jgi:hypothetical protein
MESRTVAFHIADTGEECFVTVRIEGDVPTLAISRGDGEIEVPLPKNVAHVIAEALSD